MQLFYVWLTALVLITSISLGWYVTLPIVSAFADGIANYTSADPNARNIVQLVEFANFVWGPIMVIFILFWAIIYSQKRDVESEMQYV